MSRSLVSRRFAGGLMVAAGLVCAAPASAADLDVFGFAASPSPVKVHKFRASPIKAGVLSARVVVLNRGRNSVRGARVVLGLSADRKVDPGDVRLDPQRRVTLGRRPLVQVRMAARVPANIPRDAKYAFACVIVPRSTNPEPRPVGVARASGNPADGTNSDSLDCKMGPRSVGQTTWDWSVQPRYGADKDGDDITDAVRPDDERGPEIVPRLWPVKMKASSCSDSDLQRGAWRWVVEDDGGNVIAGAPTECQLTYGFAKEGEYVVTLQELDRNGNVKATTAKTVTVKDVLIVSLGDSIASGEGAPQRPRAQRDDDDQQEQPPMWQDTQGCHRSPLAGPARAAKALEDADDKTSVTFVHLACTGATMGGSKPIWRQIRRMKTLTEGRKIDAVTLSIGANDIKFAKIAEDCFELDDCSDAEAERSPRPAADADLEALPMLYGELATELKNATRRESEQARETEVFLTEYPDPLLARVGVCQKSEFKWWPIGGDQTITGTEATWASTELLPDLNGKGATAALDHGWTRVTGIAEAFRGHGYCASKSARWINQGNESRRNQGDHLGTLHPNARGYQKVYAPRLTDALEHLLHPERQEPR